MHIYFKRSLEYLQVIFFSILYRLLYIKKHHHTENYTVVFSNQKDSPSNQQLSYSLLLLSITEPFHNTFFFHPVISQIRHQSCQNKKQRKHDHKCQEIRTISKKHYIPAILLHQTVGQSFHSCFRENLRKYKCL